MAELVLLNPKMYVAGLDLSGSYSQHALVIDADAVDFTAFGDLTREYKGGLKGAGSEHEGFWDNPVDDDLFTNLAAAARNTTVSPDGGDDGETAFLFSQLTTQYAPGASIGDAYQFSASNQITGLVTRGLIMATGSKTTTANGVARQLGAVTAAQSIRASLHVLAIAGTSPTLDVIVQSASDEAMTAPTTRLTFTQAIAISGQLVTAAGPVTDTWWRASWTIGGTGSPSASFVVSAGIS